ncbi:four helix bundle protein [Cyanobacterium aponinum UTEX 3221]|uniref:four helix bundle protein n=1 Tax=Cyanobacterium aponinum TaxID=379064 RepID=UPI001F5018DF|nr:four helix bundle protein [Cyanobacterium aponinum]WRL36928.1 four helix bundle protein [Cyanobacterium aponinum UTEX 3221]
MIELKSYRDLTVWQKSMDLVVICYQLTSQFPKTEIYGLSSQIQRAAVSIPELIVDNYSLLITHYSPKPDTCNLQPATCCSVKPDT